MDTNHEPSSLQKPTPSRRAAAGRAPGCHQHLGRSPVVTLSAKTGQAILRSRLSRGKDQRFKTFDYQPDHVVRNRRNPGQDPTTPPQQWAMSSSKKVDYPQSINGTVITDAYVLLLLAQRLQASPEQTAEVVVHTDFNFYQVQMTSGKGITIPVDYQVTGGRAVTGMRDTRAVKLQISPVEPLAEKPDFSARTRSSDAPASLRPSWPNAAASRRCVQ